LVTIFYNFPTIFIYYSQLHIRVTTIADAAVLGLPGCAAVPGQLDPPPSGDGVVDQAGIDRLHFDATGGDSDAPVFVVLPLVYPLALGEVPFLQSITDPLDSPAALSCGARVWFDGLRYLATFNAGLLLHSHPLLFNAADLPAEHFPTSTLGDSAQVAITTVGALSAHYGHVTVLHRETGNGAFLAHTSLLPAPARVTPTRPAVLASGPPGLGVSNLDDFTSAISTAITTTLGSAAPPVTTHVERALKQDQEDVMTRYQITWGRVVTVLDPIDGSASEQVVLPELTAQFKAVVTPSKASKAEAAFHESFDNHLRSKRRSVLFLDGMASWDGRVWGLPGVQSLREFRWAKDPPIIDHEEVKELLGIYHFAPTNPGSASYQSCMEDGRVLIRQQLVGEDKSKLRRSQSELYYQGSLATAHDLKTTIANFWTFGT
jgi:hypothetical protein